MKIMTISGLSSLRWRKISSFMPILLAALLVFSFTISTGCGVTESSPVLSRQKSINTGQNRTLVVAPRKLLSHGKEELKAKEKASQDLIKLDYEDCPKSNIEISQGWSSPLANGIPTYSVQIMNVCDSGRDISNIHLSCGWFSSARLIDPRIFRRLSYDDCLVNDGKPLVGGSTLSFQYANEFSYTLSVSSITC